MFIMLGVCLLDELIYIYILLNFNTYKGLKTTINTININNIVGISLNILKNFDEYLFSSSFEFV